jgi:UDP-N-acetylmuramoylalanine--D-glutamate ligase
MPRLATRFPDLTGLKVLVIGAGASGRAAARLAVGAGAAVLVNDRRSATELADAHAEAGLHGYTLRAGDHPLELIDDTDIVVLSPGVPPDNVLVEAAVRRGLPVWGEVEIAARFCRGQVIGITGSNGKSTVTALTGHILRVAGIPGGTGGNLAIPFSDLLSDDADDAVHAVELSSFQLETVETLHPRVATILNLSADHLDRYPTFEAYAQAKARLLELQDEGDFTILSADDEPSERFYESVRGQLHRFSTVREIDRGACLTGDMLVLRTDAGDEELVERNELRIAGDHNVGNALVAALASRLAGVPVSRIREGLRTFDGLPHRLERVAALRGVTFYNDSKATNPASTLRALSAFRDGTVHLILGGRDKGADWSTLRDAVSRVARRVLLVGEAAPALGRELTGIEIVHSGTVAEAVVSAFAGAREGDAVLLSPACASFDQYSSFEARGDDFRRAVESLVQTEGGGDA